MYSDIEEGIGRGLSRWVEGVRRNARSVTAAMLIATGGIFHYAIGHLGIQGDTDSLFAADLPFRQAEHRYVEAFPMLYENIFVVVDAATPERAGEAASALALGLQAEPEHFHSTYLPGGGDFFERHAFLYLETEELEKLADRVAEVQPYLAELSRDGTLRNLASLMARGVRAVREGDVGGAEISSMFGHFGGALRAWEEGRPYQLSWAQVLAGEEFEADARRRFLLVQPVLDVHSLQPAKEPILAVRRIARSLGLTSENGVRVRITGDVALSYEEMGVVRTQAAMAGLASFALVAGILALGLRSGRLVLATLLTLAVGLIWTAGFTALAIGHFNMISVSFAVLFIGLGVDFGVHVCVRYRELLRGGREHAHALSETARDVGSSICLCAITTAIGFFAFVPTDFLGVAELGLISGAGMFISLFCTLTLLPALLTLSPPRVKPSTGPGWTPSGLFELPVRYPRAVRGAALALGLAAIFALPKARFDNNPLNVRDPRSESVRTFNDLLERGSTSPWSLNTVAPDMDSAAALADRLRALDVVERVVTVSDFVPEEQDEKLDIIGDVAIFLAPFADAAGKVSPPPAAKQIEALEQLRGEIAKLLAEGAPAELEEGALLLAAELDRYLARLAELEDPGPAISAVESSVLGSLPEQLRMLNRALTAGHVTLENLPDALLERMVAADGSVRLQVFPSRDLKDHAALAAFVDGVSTIEPHVAGSAVEILESGRAVVHALRQALVSAVVMIALVLFLLWRRLTDTALVLIPLALAATFTVASAVLIGIPFNFADVIVLPLLLGIGVDSGIHLVHRVRASEGRETNLLATGTARAVAISALTTIASFGTLGLATHRGLATLGQLLTLGVGFTLVCNLGILPSLIALHAPRRSLVEGRFQV